MPKVTFAENEDTYVWFRSAHWRTKYVEFSGLWRTNDRNDIIEFELYIAGYRYDDFGNTVWYFDSIWVPEYKLTIERKIKYTENKS